MPAFTDFDRSPVGAGLFNLWPLVAKELRAMLRSRRAYVFLWLMAVGAGTALWLVWQGAPREMPLGQRAQISRDIFIRVAQIQLLALGLISPLMTASGITQERENKTMDLLFCTGFSTRTLVLGKWFAATCYQAVILICLMPILSLTFQLGGVGLDDYLFAALMILATILTYGMVGLACSSLFRRSLTAQFVTLLAVLGLSLLPMPFSAPKTLAFYLKHGLTLVLISHAFMQVMLGVAAYRFSVRHLAKGEPIRAARKVRYIDDPQLLAIRRREFPYYLIDPLARPQDIRDGQNPVYVKEQRVGALARAPVLIRLSYLTLFLSMFLIIPTLRGEPLEIMRMFGRGIMALILVFAPIFSAVALSREREERTLEMLRATLLTPWQVVRAKLLIVLRFLAMIGPPLLIMPLISRLSMDLFYARLNLTFFEALTQRAWPVLRALLCLAPYLVSMSVLICAIGLFCSSFCRRNLTAIIAAYAATGILVGLPFAVDYVLGQLRLGPAAAVQLTGATRWMLQMADSLRRFVFPLFSPFDYFPGGDADAKHFYDQWLDLAQVAAQAGVALGLATVLLWFTCRRVRRGPARED